MELAHFTGNCTQKFQNFFTIMATVNREYFKPDVKW